MTTSGRFSELRHPEGLEDELQRRQARNLPDVERRRNFIDVEPREPHATELAQEVEQLARGQSASRRNTSPGRDRWIERVDVERDVERVAADARADFVRQLGARPAMRGGGRDERDAHLVNELHLVPVVVPAPEQRHLPGIDLTQLEASPQSTAVRPAAVAGRIIQGRGGGYVEDAQVSV